MQSLLDVEPDLSHVPLSERQVPVWTCVALFFFYGLRP